MRVFQHKYRASRISHAGYSFASRLEASVFDMIKMMELAGEIKFLRSQVHVPLTEAKIVYIVDFLVEDIKTGQEIYYEAKGFETPEWKIKKRLWKHYGPGPLLIYGGSYKNPRFIDEVIPTTKKIHENTEDR